MAQSEAGLSSPVVAGTYSVANGSIVLTGETGPGGGLSGHCEPRDRGDYVPTFTPDCASLDLSLRSEDCDDRGRPLNRLPLFRQ